MIGLLVGAKVSGFVMPHVDPSILKDVWTGRRQRGVRVVGRRALLRQSPFATPRRGEPRRGLRPRLACRNKRLRAERLRRSAEFQRRYRKAYAEYRAGNRDVVW